MSQAGKYNFSRLGFHVCSCCRQDNVDLEWKPRELINLVDSHATVGSVFVSPYTCHGLCHCSFEVLLVSSTAPHGLRTQLGGTSERGVSRPAHCINLLYKPVASEKKSDVSHSHTCKKKVIVLWGEERRVDPVAETPQLFCPLAISFEK